MNRDSVLKKYLRSALILAVFEILLVVGSIWLIFFAYTTYPESSYWIKRRIISIFGGIIGLYVSLPCLIAVVKNVIFLLLDLHRKEDIVKNIHINRGMVFYLPGHTFHLFSNFSSIPKYSFPFDVFWSFAFTRSHYLMDASLMYQKRKIHNRVGTKVVLTKYAHVVLSIES